MYLIQSTREKPFYVESDLVWMLASLKNEDNQKYEMYNSILNWTYLLPVSIVREIFSELRNQCRSKDPSPYEVAKSFNEMEQVQLFEEIAKCYKTAAILPSYLSYSFAGRLKEKGAAVGTEKFYEPTTSFYLRGLVPNYILQRIKGMHESGIWKWWVSVPKWSRNGEWTPKNVHRAPGPVKIEGNVQAVFILFLGGSGMSIILLIVEITNLFLKRKCNGATLSKV